MKKNFMMGMFALAALAMTSCSMNDVVRQQDNAINFGTYTGRGVQAKSAELNNTNLTNFGVFASYTAETDFSDNSPLNFMFNQLVTGSTGGSWTYSPKKYWPTDQDEKISFFAYAPYATDKCIKVSSVNSHLGCPVINYTLDKDILDQAEDFVADVLVNEIRTSSSADGDGNQRDVKFNFMHELTRVAFFAQLDRKAYDAGDGNLQTQVNIKNITFGGTNLVTSADYTFAAYDNTRGTWNATISGSNLDVTKLIERTNENLGEYVEWGYRLKDTNGQNLFGEGDYLFLIPMNGVTGISAQNVTFTIDYDIVTVDPSLSKGHSVTSATKVITIPDGFLKQGTAYNFNLTFYLNEVVFDAEVSPWNTPTDGSENVDWNDVDKI